VAKLSAEMAIVEEFDPAVRRRAFAPAAFELVRTMASNIRVAG